MSQASRAARTETAQSLGRPTMLQCILHANPPVIKCQWWVNRSNRSYCQHIPIGFHLPSILESESHCVQLPVIGQWHLTIFQKPMEPHWTLPNWSPFCWWIPNTKLFPNSTLPLRGYCTSRVRYMQMYVSLIPRYTKGVGNSTTP